MCSTPFGIIGIRTLWRPSPLDYLHLCAQRLSASSEFAPTLAALISVSDTCAQRLSASSEFARRSLRTRRREVFVLNAFRHHRNSHTRKQPHCGPHADVLNAFRHHRNSHE